MASKMARDIVQDCWDNDSILEPHPLKAYSITNMLDLPAVSHVTSKPLANLLEVYMDDFFRMIQAPTMAELQKFTRAILKGIHSIFPPPGLLEDQMDKPVSLKKLKSGDGMWSTQKEILGWVFNGITCCMQLPMDKVTKL